MSAIEMLSLQMTLDTHPGSVPPILHLKKGSGSVSLTVYFRMDGLVIDEPRTVIVKGMRPDGSELYISTVSIVSSNAMRIFLAAANVKKMAEVAGRYIVEATIFDVRSGVNRRNVSAHDTLTTAKFYVDVEDSAYREEEA